MAKKNIKRMAKDLADLYDGPITLSELQDKLFNSPLEVPGPTPPRDEQIYKIVYGYLQSQPKASVEQSGSFAPQSGGGWICCGRELAKLLAKFPDTSLTKLIEFAEKNGYRAEVTS
jgi:hypothetical protein